MAGCELRINCLTKQVALRWMIEILKYSWLVARCSQKLGDSWLRYGRAKVLRKG